MYSIGGVSVCVCVRDKVKTEAGGRKRATMELTTPVERVANGRKWMAKMWIFQNISASFFTRHSVARDPYSDFTISRSTCAANFSVWHRNKTKTKDRCSRNNVTFHLPSITICDRYSGWYVHTLSFRIFVILPLHFMIWISRGVSAVVNGVTSRSYE